MEVFVNVVEVHNYWSMTTSLHFPVVVVVRCQIFNFYVNDVIEVNPIVVIVKFTKKKWELIVVREILRDLAHQNPPYLPSVQELRKKG
jgi:hypothetical protein